MKQPDNTKYSVALYMRLSRDDENYGDSVSIETQRTILRQYANDHNLYVIDEYVDDGWSGTNFERPSFKRMMEDVDSGRVNCIITKDLSRFGREHVMMDYYLEFVFPEKQIRYIAVAENEDTEKGLSDFVPFKNLFNEWFAKDTSRKVKTALHAKFAAGQKICTYTPLGCVKHPEIKNSIVIDPETSWIIEKIFNLAMHGSGAAKIAKTLIAEKVPTAGYLNYKRYGTFANIYAGAPEEKSYAWTIAQVKSILKDETYIGNSVHNKQTYISYKNKRRVRKSPDEWFKVENTHEGIVSKEVFEQVQGQITARRRQMKTATTQIFAGLLRCSDCGWSMCYGTNKARKSPYSYYNCTNYRQLGKSGGHCTAHYIRYDVLYAYVLSRLQYWIEQANISEDKLIKRLLKSGDSERDRAIKKQTAELAKAEKRRAEVDRLFVKMYEDWTAERITGYNFSMMSQKYQAEQQELIAKIDKLKAELSAERENADGAERWICLIEQYSRPTELTAELLNALIEKIVIHEATKGYDGTREQEIEIFYRFVGKID